MSYLTCAQWHSCSPCCSHVPCRFSGSRPQKSYLTCFQWPIFFPCCRYAFQFSRSTMQKSYLYKNAFSGPSLFLAAPIPLDFPGQKCENPISRAFSGPSFSVAAPMSHLDFLGQNQKKYLTWVHERIGSPCCAHVPLTCFGPKPTFLLNNKAKDNVVFLIPGIHTTRYSPNTCVIWAYPKSALTPISCVQSLAALAYSIYKPWTVGM